MARARRELPPPLPPETRTIGQLVAETIRLYASRFWPSLALGVGPAALVVLSTVFRSFWALTGIAVAAGVVSAAVFVGACVIAKGETPGRRTLLAAYAVAVVVSLPAPFIPILWLSLLGLSVPAVVMEGRRGADAFRRGWQLARADLVHAIGSVAALFVTGFVLAWVMVILLRAGSDQSVRISAGLSSLVISPGLFLGVAMLYFDQAARASKLGPSRERSSNADLHPAVDADGPGRPDAEVESRAAARGES